MKSPIDGHPSLVKDTMSGIISNRCTTERERYRLARKMSRETIDSRHEINSLKKEMNELKDLIHQLLDKK
jgi:hypothetical protein